MSNVKMPEPYAWGSFNVLTKSEYLKRVPVTSMQAGVYQHTKLFSQFQMEAYAAAKVREALTWEDVWRLVRNTGYVTKGQADEIADLILAHLRGEQPAPGAQEGA